MTCNQAEELILESLDSPPGAAGGEALAVHLAACAGCRAFLESQTALDGLFARHMMPPAPSPGFDARLAQALRAEREGEFWELVPDVLHVAGGAIVTLAAALALAAEAGLVWTFGGAATVASYALYSLVQQWLSEAEGDAR